MKESSQFVAVVKNASKGFANTLKKCLQICKMKALYILYLSQLTLVVGVFKNRLGLDYVL